MLVVAACLITFDRAFAQYVAGQVVRVTGQPVPGCVVSIVNSVARSSPSVTDSTGHYYFSDIPVGYYYLEVYWGYTLLYRSTLVVMGDTQNYAIVLP